MSLATDSIFITALQTNAELMEALGYAAPTDNSEGVPPRLYGTAIPLPDEDADNAPVPYIIVMFDGLQNDEGTKDDRYESQYDKVNISIEVAAKEQDDLETLTKMVRSTILTYLQENETAIEDYHFSAEGIVYNADKPCFWQVLTYQCDVNNAYDDGTEETNE